MNCDIRALLAAVTLSVWASIGSPSASAAGVPTARLAGTLSVLGILGAPQQREGARETVVGRVVDVGDEHIVVRADRDERLFEFRVPDVAELRELLQQLRPGRRVEAVGIREPDGDVWVLQELHPLGEPEGEQPVDEEPRGERRGQRSGERQTEPAETREQGTPSAKGRALYSEDFEDGQAQGWELAPGWELATHPRGNRCLHGQGHTWARYAEGSWGDFTLALRLKLISGGIHINYRIAGGRRYFIGVRQNGTYLSKQTGPETFFDQLATGPGLGRGNRFVPVEVSGTGGRIQVRVGGKAVLNHEDRDPLLQGGIAFETLDDSEAYVDDIVVTGGAGQPVTGPEAAGPSLPTAQVLQIKPLVVQARFEPPTVAALPSSPADPPAYVLPAMVAGMPLKPIQQKLEWERTGGPRGGLGYDVRMDPYNPDTMFVSDAWAGVFKSTDGGRKWQPLNQGIATRRGLTREAFPIFCLTIDAHRSSTVWAGTKDEGGLFKSNNGGQSWQEMTNGLPANKSGLTFRGITVHPHDRNIVYASAEISSWVWAGKLLKGKQAEKTRGVVYRTVDGGGHWQQVWEGANLARYIIIHPDDPRIIYISTGIFDREAANTTQTNDGAIGIYRSMDGGQTWQQINNGLKNRYVGSLFMHPDNPKVLLAGTGMNQWWQDAGVYLTVDAGQSWQCTLKGDVITAVEFAPGGPPYIAYAGSAKSIYRSADMGQSWTRMTPRGEYWGAPGIRGGWPIDFQVDPHNPNRLFANAYLGGNFLSTDGGQTWQNASKGYSGAQMRDLTPDPNSPQRIHAACRTGVFVTHNRGDDWLGLNYPEATGIGWIFVALDPADPQHLLGACQADPPALFRSLDGGQSWKQLPTKLPQGVTFRSLVFASPTQAYVGTAADLPGWLPLKQEPNKQAGAGVYASTDGGQSWHPANQGVSQNAFICQLATVPNSPQTVYAAALAGGLLRTTTGGGSWQRLTTGLPQQPWAISVAVHPTNPNIVYVGYDDAGLYRSADGGKTFGPAMAGLDANSSISCVLFDRKNPNVVYAADRKSGVYRYDQIEQQWIPINLGLANREVNVLAISSDGRDLYAGTEGAGVFRLDLTRG
jgi:photosystem II stability/assembly factor-like uncharacterized protein